MGVTEQIIFPEINYDEVDAARYGHHDHHDGAHGRRGPRPAARLQLPAERIRGYGQEIDDRPREAKRARTVARYAKKRAELKAVIEQRPARDEEKWDAQVALQKLPRNASPVRQQNVAAR
jgi:hypothetical protein